MRALAPALFALAALAVFLAPAHAQASDDAAGAFWGADIAVMAADELEAHRGGFAIAPGIEISFGAMITTFVNGAPALTTMLTWGADGAISGQTIAQIGDDLSHLTPEQRAELGLAGLDNAGGIFIQDASGVTALVHRVTQSALQNIIINTASGRDVSQHIGLTLTLHDFEITQAAINLELFGLRLNDDLGYWR